MADLGTASSPGSLIITGLLSVKIVGAWGIGIAARHKGLLGGVVDKGQAKFTSSICLPCLILSKVVADMSPAALALVWPLGVVCVVVVLYGLVAGALIGRMMKLIYPNAFPRYTRLCQVAIAFPNSFATPLTLLLSVGDHPVLQADGLSGKDLEQRIMALFLVSYVFWVFTRWSIGYPLLAGAAKIGEWQQQVLNAPVVACIVASMIGLLCHSAPEELQAHWLPGGALAPIVDVLRTPLEYAGRCAVPMILFGLGSKLYEAGLQVRDTGLSKCLHGADADSDSEGTAELMEPIKPANGNGVSNGVNGVNGVNGTHSNGIENGANVNGIHSTNGNGNSHSCDEGMPLMAHIIVLLFRQVGGGIVGAATALGLQWVGVQDRVVLMVGMLQCAGPPTPNLSLFANLNGSRQLDLETAKLMLLTYPVSILTSAFWVAAFLHLLQ